MCDVAIAKGFNAISAEDISLKLISEQRTLINGFFKEIFTKLGLSYSPPVLSPITDEVEPEVPVKNKLLHQSMFLLQHPRFDVSAGSEVKGLDEDDTVAPKDKPTLTTE